MADEIVLHFEVEGEGELAGLVGGEAGGLEGVPGHEGPVGERVEVHVAPAEEPGFAEAHDLLAGEREGGVGAERLGLAGLLVDLAGQDGPALGDGGEDGAEGGDVEVDAGDARGCKLGGRVAGGAAHVGLDVIPPDGLAFGAALAAGEEDGALGGVLLGLVERVLALGVDGPGALDGETRHG